MNPRHIVRAVAITPIWIYRMAISPFTASCCRFTPSCSTYAQQAISRHGACRGGVACPKTPCPLPPLGWRWIRPRS